MQQRSNLFLFLILSFLILFGWGQLRLILWPPPPKQQTEETKKDDKDKDRESPAGLFTLLTRYQEGRDALLPTAKEPPAALFTFLGRYQERVAELRLQQPLEAPRRGQVYPALTLGAGGDAEQAKKYFLQVLLERRGAGVRSVILKQFQAASEEGHPQWKDKAKQVPTPLELVPSYANAFFASHLLYHYDTLNGDDASSRPVDTLGRSNWQVYKDDKLVSEADLAAGDPSRVLTTRTLEDGRQEQRVEFRARVRLKRKAKEPAKRFEVEVEIRKIYTLAQGDYHIGLEVRFERQKTGGPYDRPDFQFRYQLTGAHGLPIEGMYYTGIFRNAMVAQVSESGTVDRKLEDLREISLYSGGNTIDKTSGKRFRYLGIVNQYFASIIIVSDKQPNNGTQDIIHRVRPTLETAVTKGVVKEVRPDGRSFALLGTDGKETVFHLVEDMDSPPSKDNRVAVVHFTDSNDNYWATAVLSAAQAQPLFIDDITVRLTSEAVDLEPGVPVAHRYLLYNGPIKASLLGHLGGDAAVRQELVDEYAYKLNLNTLVDYPSPTWFGAFGNAIYFTPLVIKATNLMHWILWKLHQVIPSYGLCIILLTVMVRGLMFPVSRQQAMTSMKMQELAPEMRKMQEKYKDDRQGMAAAQMALYRKHGVNPFASCWFLLLQMPIYMGLYFAFQESIAFRLAPFWPLWITNLAAPDMLFRWGEGIPILSTPDSYGGILYLGPYFNLLPIIAVVLMLMQQKMMTPPPTDEQQEMQFKMLKYMTIFFGLMFYKVAAGLCIYFIASSIWGFLERKFLPKKKPTDVITSADTLLQATLAPAGAPATATAYTSSGGKSGKKGRKKRQREESGRRSDSSGEQDGKRGWWQRLREWWADVRKKAEKK